MNYHDARDFRLFAESFIYGIRTIHTDIQTRIPFYTSMWGSLRLAPIMQVVYVNKGQKGGSLAPLDPPLVDT